MNAEISVVGVNVSFGPRHVLKDISLGVPKGELVVVMGSSGGGKTTLLRTIAGLTPSQTGTVTVCGLDVRRDSYLAREAMGMVFQSSALFDYLTIDENVAFGVKRHTRLSQQQIKERVDGLLERVGLAGSGHLYPSQLSGGMRKRAGLARALALEPKVMLYDEPTTGLDPIFTYQMDQLIVGVNRSLGMTSIVVSHDLGSAKRIADRLVFLHQGRILFDGSTKEFWKSDQPPILELLQAAESLSV